MSTVYRFKTSWTPSNHVSHCKRNISRHIWLAQKHLARRQCIIWHARNVPAPLKRTPRVHRVTILCYCFHVFLTSRNFWDNSILVANSLWCRRLIRFIIIVPIYRYTITRTCVLDAFALDERSDQKEGASRDIKTRPPVITAHSHSRMIRKGFSIISTTRRDLKSANITICIII